MMNNGCGGDGDLWRIAVMYLAMFYSRFLVLNGENPSVEYVNPVINVLLCSRTQGRGRRTGLNSCLSSRVTTRGTEMGGALSWSDLRIEGICRELYNEDLIRMMFHPDLTVHSGTSNE